MNPAILTRAAILFGILAFATAGGISLFSVEVRSPSEAVTAPEGFVLTNLESRVVSMACEPMKLLSPEARDAVLAQARLSIPALYETRKGKGRKGAGKSKAEAFTGVMDLNAATVEELSSIKGLGAKMAEGIVKYRTEHGPFRNVTDLTSVKRVGQKLVDKISPHLSIKEPSGGWPSPPGQEKSGSGDGTDTGDGTGDAGKTGKADSGVSGSFVSGEDADTVIGDAVIGDTVIGDTVIGEKVDLNTATAEELTKVKGIGAKTAGNIVRNRQENGPFATVDDLTRVPRVGQKLVDKIRDLVMVVKP